MYTLNYDFVFCYYNKIPTVGYFIKRISYLEAESPRLGGLIHLTSGEDLMVDGLTMAEACVTGRDPMARQEVRGKSLMKFLFMWSFVADLHDK